METMSSNTIQYFNINCIVIRLVFHRSEDNIDLFMNSGT